MTKNQESIVSSATYGGCGCLFLLMCIGVIAALALPSLLNSSNKSKQSEAKQYLSAIKNEIKTISILCETDARGTIKPAQPIYQNGKIACGKGTIDFMK